MSDFDGIMSDKYYRRNDTVPLARRESALNPRVSAVRRVKSEGVIDKLGLEIVSGKRAPGDLLPTEADLSRSLGISRPSLREGLRALAQKGLVEGRTRRGTTINERQRWDVLDADVLRWYAAATPDPDFLRDLVDVRVMFEPAAARMAAARASVDQIVGIEEAFRGMAAALPHDLEACHVHDLAFHERIIASTGNRFMIRIAAAIRTALLSTFRVASNARESYKRSLVEHWAVAAAIRRRNPDEADQAMRQLLAGTARDLAPAFEHPRDKPVARRSRPAGSGTRRRS
ncbi:MAG: FadR/GntR family transcriptional regulator [Casimicrobiaceae bacterium]